MTESGDIRPAAAAFGDLDVTSDLGTLLERAVACALATITGDCAGIVLLAGHGLERRQIAASDGRATEADRLRQELADGPDDVPARTELIRDTAAETHWPRWAPLVAAELGLRSVLTTGLPGRPYVRGSITIYATRPDAFSAADQALAEPLAAHIAVAVMATVTARSLERAIDARTEVGQAVGVLMERFDIGADDAFAMLRRHSQAHNVRLRTIAAELLDERRHTREELSRYDADLNKLLRRVGTRSVQQAG
ncbi:GAF and ANTAR domain-containing protein (plasmid) [Kribbella sp. CWNU-51]